MADQLFLHSAPSAGKGGDNDRHPSEQLSSDGNGMNPLWHCRDQNGHLTGYAVGDDRDLEGEIDFGMSGKHPIPTG